MDTNPIKVTQGVAPEEILRFQIRRTVTLLFKSYLVLLEDIGIEHDRALGLLYDKLPPEYQTYVELADYLDEETGERLRKKVLGAGNDCCRSIDEILKSFTISLKQ